MKLLLYCTKSKKQKDLLWANNLSKPFMDGRYNRLIDDLPKYLLNGKVVGECDFEVEEIEYEYSWKGYENTDYFTNKLTKKELEKQSCLTNEELKNYLKLKPLCCVKGKTGYAIHIKNLHIFDEPKELNKFKQKGEYQCSKRKCPYFNTEKCHYASECLYEKIITKAPQNMMYVYDGEEKKVLISIHPEWLCKILNGEKTIEVRKKILKGMLENDK